MTQEIKPNNEAQKKDLERRIVGVTTASKLYD